MALILEEPTAWQSRWPLMWEVWATMCLAGPYVPGTPLALSDQERRPRVICEEGARVGSVTGFRIPGWALALVFLLPGQFLFDDVRLSESVGCAEGLATAVRGWPQG